mmetsp:Transcript_40394/g.46354  ORF Transcript_40394/g.46354 Transcript_40394/m.46354 type:complete len:97 (+) Transcript_40394:257-547(+)
MGSILALATADGTIKIMNTSDFEIICVIDTKKCFSEDVPSITALSCNLEREIIVGFSNGATMSYNTKEAKQNHLFIENKLFDDLKNPPPVQQIKTS